MALRFFSRLPTGSRPHERPSLERIAPTLPLASLAIGALPAGVLIAALWGGLPPLFAALLAVAASAMVTGAMSEDALADAADGLFGGSTPERRLDILKDSRHGTYGVLAIVLMVGLKATALAAIAGAGPLTAAGLWLAAGVLARSGALYLAFALPPARASGAAATAGRLSRNAFALGAVVALAIAALLALPLAAPWALLLGAGLAGLVLWGWTRLCDRLVGGQTGDLVGAAQALVEITILATFMGMVVR
ncbi:adenosylcobinamide-GDP ribazoletransferase [Pelagibacterium lacus]|uniref:Adenosylcobinamide-GDP ribazoletransferase n=2 Tax=Pelagibacterium lacus TaxID=2282655 RepID=A0A369WB88_9HYPH|nr:adenosylcobinamide-GDP ribazoletransferase [Pelagibacterium lacus]